MFQNLYNPEALQKVLSDIFHNYPALLAYSDILEFKHELSQTKFIFHGGDCAEPLAGFDPKYVERQAQILESTKEGLFILRGAGQFFKPRSNFYDGDKLNYFGDGVNGIDPKDRAPDPERLRKAYFVAAEKMRYLNSRKYKIFTSHEALFIPYEEAFLRQEGGITYSSAAHMLWLGYRNAKMGFEQVEFLAKIANPVGIKVGPDTDFVELKEIMRILNPQCEDFKITLIVRFGASRATESCKKFNDLINSINQKIKVIIDPLHGNNTIYNSQKMRKMEDILKESAILRRELKFFDGVSLEFTPDDNLECMNHPDDIIVNRSLCDPRVNSSQVVKIIHQLYS
jgi:3-deoxy-7-phosphoheptulonate synthase